jgi:hypothetical protein
MDRRPSPSPTTLSRATADGLSSAFKLVIASHWPPHPRHASTSTSPSTQSPLSVPEPPLSRCKLLSTPCTSGPITRPRTPSGWWLYTSKAQRAFFFVRCPVISLFVMLVTLFCTQRSPPFPQSHPAPEDLHSNPLLGIGNGLQIARGSTARGYCQRLQASRPRQCHHIPQDG